MIRKKPNFYKISVNTGYNGWGRIDEYYLSLESSNKRIEYLKSIVKKDGHVPSIPEIQPCFFNEGNEESPLAGGREIII